MTRCVTGHEAVQPLDLVVANAGISAGTRKLGNAPWADDREVFAVNVNGVANTVEPALELLQTRLAPERGGLRGVGRASGRGRGGQVVETQGVAVSIKKKNKRNKNR